MACMRHPAIAIGLLGLVACSTKSGGETSAPPAIPASVDGEYVLAAATQLQPLAPALRRYVIVRQDGTVRAGAMPAAPGGGFDVTQAKVVDDLDASGPRIAVRASKGPVDIRQPLVLADRQARAAAVLPVLRATAGGSALAVDGGGHASAFVLTFGASGSAAEAEPTPLQMIVTDDAVAVLVAPDDRIDRIPSQGGALDRQRLAAAYATARGRPALAGRRDVVVMLSRTADSVPAGALVTLLDTLVAGGAETIDIRRPWGSIHSGGAP